jgi:hypothetical protein
MHQSIIRLGVAPYTQFAQRSIKLLCPQECMAQDPKLNHLAVSWDSTGTTLVGPANIRELIPVAPGGKTYNGSFTLDQYDTNGNLIVHFAGSVTGQRITAD